MEPPVLVEIIRNGMVESRHRGAVAVVEPRGTVVRSTGAIDQPVYIRSAGKPFHMISAVRGCLLEHFGFSAEELAVMVASHSGELYHIELVQSILTKAGLTKADLRCGIHLPNDVDARQRLSGLSSDVLYNNCSGQHAGLLAWSVLIGADLKSYNDLKHKSQQQMLSTLAMFSGERIESMPAAVDGCSLPVFAIPLARLARAYARLVNPSEFDPQTRSSCRRIVEAMLQYPRAVGGINSLCTNLMTACSPKLVTKTGAEGIYCMGVLPERYPDGLGIAIKVEDGAERALGPVAVETLSQLGLLSRAEKESLLDWHSPTIRNWNGEVTGHMRPVLHLTGGYAEKHHPVLHPTGNSS